MDNKAFWQKLSGSINYYLRWVDRYDLLMGNPTEVFASFMEGMAGEEDGTYEYLDKQTFKYIKLTDEDIAKMQEAFLKRFHTKKVKYLDQETL